MFDLLWLLIAIPLASAGILLVWGKESDGFGHLIGTAASAASFVLAILGRRWVLLTLSVMLLLVALLLTQGRPGS